MSLDQEFFKAVLPEVYLSRYLAKGLRTDGRALEETRSVSFQSEHTHSILKAGSSSILSTVSLLQHDLPDMTIIRQSDPPQKIFHLSLCLEDQSGSHQDRLRLNGYLTQTIENLLEQQMAPYFSAPRFQDRYVQINSTVVDDQGSLLANLYLSVLLTLLCHDFAFPQAGQELEQENDFITVSPCDLFYPATFCSLLQHTIQDPDLQEESLSRMNLTIFVQGDRVLCHKVCGGPMDLAMVPSLVKCSSPGRLQLQSLVQQVLSSSRVGHFSSR